MPQQAHTEVEQLFRRSYSKLLSSLIVRFGTAEMSRIEDAVMEAYLGALKNWPHEGTPSNPEGWLYKVSFRKLLNSKALKQNQSSEIDYIADLSDEQEADNWDLHEVKDPELRLLFMICHPDLKKEDQLAFTLKTISGFGRKEIAETLLQSEETIKKRLARSRKFIKENQLVFDWPEKKEIETRIEIVHKALYLLFNEGYYSSHADRKVHKDFCLEAMRLCKYLCDHPIGNADSKALMSMMCFHISRFEGRLDESGNLILLRDQDRSKWDPYFIKLGDHYLSQCTTLQGEKTAWQIEAVISGQHSYATSIETTNWDFLEMLYNALYDVKPEKLVLLNLVLVLIMAGKLGKAKKLFEELNENDFGRYKTNYFFTGVELYKKLSDQFQTDLWMQKAMENSSQAK